MPQGLRPAIEHVACQRPCHVICRPIMNQEIAELYKLLNICAEKSDIPSIKRIISNNFELLCQAKKHSTSFLHQLIESDKHEILDAIFNAFDENFRNPNLPSHYKAIEATVRSRFFDQENAFGDTPLILCARYTRAELLLKFLQNHACVNHVNLAGSSALREATEEESPETIGNLLAYSADAHTKNADKLSPLDIAIKKENIALFSMLFHGNKIRENTGLATAAEESTTDLDLAYTLFQLVRQGDIESLKSQLDQIVAQSENQMVKINPFVLKSAEHDTPIFKLLNHYKNGIYEKNIRGDAYAFSADAAPAANERNLEPGEGIRIVGTPQDMDIAPAAGLS